VRVNSAVVPARGSSLPAFTVFSWLWAAGMVSHLSSYGEPVRPTTVAVFLLAVLVLFRPSSTASFVALLLAHLAYVFEKMPHIPNHSLLAACIDLTILSAVAVQAGRLFGRASGAIDRGDVYRSFAPVVRIELLVLYFFVVFHKFNDGFFDKDSSCGAFMYLRLAREYPLLPTADWMQWSAIFLTILIEAAIPILLVVRGWRLAGLLLAFAFHFSLAMDPGDVVFNFSAILVAIFFLFLPDDFPEALGRTLSPLRSRLHAMSLHRVRYLALKTAGYIFVAALLALLIFRDAINTGLTFEASRVVWVAYAAFIVALFATTLGRSRVHFQSASELLRAPVPALLIFPVLMAANGLLPYFGTKTETAFAMYSNLRTEGGYSNHWVMPASLQVWGYQRDLVTIRRISVPRIQRLANRGYQWPYFEFKWLVRDYPDASLTYEHNGVVKRLKRIKDDPELAAPDSYLQRKFMKFRPVPRDVERTPCIH
jgi:hypothetical protein